MKFFIGTVFLALTLFGDATGDIIAYTRAQDQCRSIHHVDADDYGTRYANHHCRLFCNIHGTIHSHNINEGQNCLGGQDYICRNGECISYHRLGHIDIEIISASLYEQANAYATVCLLNNSRPIHLPIQDRRECISCSTHVKQHTNYPVWNEVCAGSSNYLFTNDARVTIEVWNHYGPKNNGFLGGVTLTINQLLKNNDNHRAINLPMTGGHNPGQLTSRITWTPRN